MIQLMIAFMGMDQRAIATALPDHIAGQRLILRVAFGCIAGHGDVQPTETAVPALILVKGCLAVQKILFALGHPDAPGKGFVYTLSRDFQQTTNEEYLVIDHTSIFRVWPESPEAGLYLQKLLFRDFGPDT